MIWHDVWEDLTPGYYVHPLYTSPSSYRPAWHAVQGSLNTPVLAFYDRDGNEVWI